ncbi:hypothetical protein DNTS_002076 [Danionella cerebrum]|uniref:SEC7 domain-containing protein n=1 Tax=Danionella cerebrum TaxID=2873325 RepID=A0A553MZ66_9TELE|nr:hypothetical protein DNTS_002076 [Danionella translucida]
MMENDQTALSMQEQTEIERLKMHKQVLLDDIEKLKSQIESVMADIHDFKSAEDNKVLEREKWFCSGKKKFNMDPKKGVSFLVEQGLLEWNPLKLAEFLYKEEGLNKTAIGEFLGERQFLWSFRLPGEAQKIDRMMEAFATRYCDCNDSVFQSTDTCYILSFAIIMLNTSLHNPNVKEKTPLERFISMNRGINNGDDLPDDLLSCLYNSIKNEPFKIPEDDGNDLTHTFFNPDREGWLLKLGGRVKTWKRRWFILTDNCLYYFEFTTDKEPRGIIPLENLCVREINLPRKAFCLELFNPNTPGQKIKACKTDTDGRVVEGKHQSYTISANTAEERDQWIESIRASITKDPFYDLISIRKKKIIENACEK